MPSTHGLPLSIKELRLTEIAKAWTTLANKATKEAWEPELFLAELWELEVNHRYENRLKRLLKESELPTGKQLSQYDFGEITGVTAQQLKQKVNQQVLSARSRKSNNRLVANLRLAATTVGRSDTALGAFYKRLSARIGKSKALTAAARKIAILYYNAMRYGMQYKDPGADLYEKNFKDRVVKSLKQRAAKFGFELHPSEQCVS
jgi:hypothetical protein